ncbi:hypothetical protein R1flu_021710 [Riccia fluitans]|uniref:Uncharacterized protein n=1 Tax=Riccia fluitans TaxID=41844 RepID=A0ABD1ZQ62_9MARC
MPDVVGMSKVRAPKERRMVDPTDRAVLPMVSVNEADASTSAYRLHNFESALLFGSPYGRLPLWQSCTTTLGASLVRRYSVRMFARRRGGPASKGSHVCL